MTDSCLVVMYHYVRATAHTPFPSLKALSPTDFERQLDWLGDTHRFIDYATLEAAMAGDGALPRRSALLTFDDGVRDHYETVFPILRRRGIPGVFFVIGDALRSVPRVANVHRTHFLLARLGTERFAAAVHAAVRRGVTTTRPAAGTGPDVYRYDAAGEGETKRLLNYELPRADADRLLRALFAEHLGDEVAFARRLYLDVDRIREMAAGGMTFGFHTHRHPVLSRLTPTEQRAEIDGGVDLIRECTGQRLAPFCYPYGHAETYSDVTVRLLRDAGYLLAFTAVRRRAVPGRDVGLEIPRIDTRDLPPFRAAVAYA